MGSTGAQQWELTADQRAVTVERITASITNLAFARGVSLPLDHARQAASKAEKKAYTVAQVEARTTTGVRPETESLAAYTRKLGNLVLEAAAASSTGTDAAAANGEAQRDTLDLSHGQREFLSRELAEDALEPLLADGAAVTRIKLSTKSFDPQSAAVLARGIANVRGSLLDADLSDIIAGRPEDSALEALRIISEAVAGHGRLEGLNLSDNALGEKGVRAFAAGLSGQAALRRVAFQNVGASIKACAAIAELLPDAAALEQLHLFNNMSGDEGASAIGSLLARAPAMTDFRMASSRVGAEGAIALAQGLSSGGALLRLDVSDNPMTGEAASALSQMLSRHTGLQSLNLSDTALGDDGIAAVVQGLPPCADSLQELNLALNEVTEAGAESLAAFLQGRTALQRLLLRENELGDNGAVALAGALQGLAGLRELDLCGNQIHGRGALAVARAVAALPHLDSLQLDENEISDDAVAAIKALLAAAGKADVLGSLEENDADADDQELEEGAADISSLADQLDAAKIAP